MNASSAGAGRSATLRPRTLRSSESAIMESKSAVLGNELSFPRKSQSECADSISQLPDAVLCHILSFVPFNKSVQMSILSKRWLHIWTQLPIVDVNDCKLQPGSRIFTEQSAHTSFINFLSNVFDRCHTSPIDKFILKCSKVDGLRVTQWINAAVKRRVRELDLRVMMKECSDMSCGLFAYQELVTLKLEGRFALDVPGSLLFPSLKKLQLRGIEFDDGAIHNFLSGCPVLEDLDIVCKTDNWDTLVINAPALKFFKIYCGDNGYWIESMFKFILKSPNLEVLKYTGPEAPHGFCFGDLSSLVKAEFNVFQFSDPTDCGLDIFRGIVNAEIICLTDNTMEICYDMDLSDMPIFHNVTELRLGVSSAGYGGVFTQVIVNSPNLEVLVINVKGNGLGGFEWQEPDSVPECLSEHLEVVKIWGFDGQECIAEFIKYVLHNGEVLKECSASHLPSMLEGLKLYARPEVRVNRELLEFLAL